MKKTLYLSLLAIMLANGNIQNVEGSAEPQTKKRRLMPEQMMQQRLEIATTRLQDACEYNLNPPQSSALQEYLNQQMKWVYDQLPPEQRDGFLTKLEQAVGASEKAWKIFYTNTSAESTNIKRPFSNYSQADMTLFSFLMYRWMGPVGVNTDRHTGTPDKKRARQTDASSEQNSNSGECIIM